MRGDGAFAPSPEGSGEPLPARHLCGAVTRHKHGHQRLNIDFVAPTFLASTDETTYAWLGARDEDEEDFPPDLGELFS